MRGGGPHLSVGSAGRAEPLRYVRGKGKGLPRERSSAGDGVAIIPRCGVSPRGEARTPPEGGSKA